MLSARSSMLIISGLLLSSPWFISVSLIKLDLKNHAYFRIPESHSFAGVVPVSLIQAAPCHSPCKEAIIAVAIFSNFEDGKEFPRVACRNVAPATRYWLAPIGARRRVVFPSQES